jgi:hypothetical protein
VGSCSKKRWVGWVWDLVIRDSGETVGASRGAARGLSVALRDWSWDAIRSRKLAMPDAIWIFELSISNCVSDAVGACGETGEGAVGGSGVGVDIVEVGSTIDVGETPCSAGAAGRYSVAM